MKEGWKVCIDNQRLGTECIFHSPERSRRRTIPGRGRGVRRTQDGAVLTGLLCDMNDTSTHRSRMSTIDIQNEIAESPQKLNASSEKSRGDESDMTILAARM